ncbi:DUF4062 domain-containing protein [Microbacterium sp. P04]|uniref:DUF4062 domain-containing protein n=1 Tax=Microbacterium sp. P04 TaxID=3366947 RepID=UPI003746AB2A
MDTSTDMIRTPDQRIRVFVSSTLRELEPERAAARAAIESLRLAPVMFELGARPHPPRSLYRSYLAQSDIFVGIYGEQYGWVAPDEDVSGLEDEYSLSEGMPRLVYLRRGGGERAPRLRELLDRIRSDDKTSYRSFDTPAELQALLTDDLAVLMAERFGASSRTGVGTPAASSIPASFSSLVGREHELGAVLQLLDAPGVRLVTIVGPGGIGKSRLSIAAADALAAKGREVAFVLLEALSAPSQVVPEIARVLGVRDTGGERLQDKLVAALTGRDLVLVVDNMEHLLAASDDLVHLITALPRLQVLVTSRSPLRVRAERIFELGALTVPSADADTDDAEAASAVELFVQRAQAVRPDFGITKDNCAAVAGIVRAVDGVPLAIELAAARTRTMTPPELLARLDSALTLLVGGARDLPVRQQALRSTIEWSVRLLDREAGAAFDAIAVFRGPFSLAAAEAVLAEGIATQDGDLVQVDALGVLDALMDASLLRRFERGGELVFGTLAVVHAYALQRAPIDTAATERWAQYYIAFARTIDDHLRGVEQVPFLARLTAETENHAAVERYLLDTKHLDAAAEFAWSMYMPLWIGGRLGLVRAWMAELMEVAEQSGIELAPRTEAIALYYTRAIAFWQDPDIDVVPGLARSVALFDEVGDPAGAGLAGLSLGLAHLSVRPAPDVEAARGDLEASLTHFRVAHDVWGEAMAQVALGRLDLAMGQPARAAERLDTSVREAASEGELLGRAIAQHNRGWPSFLTGDIDAAEADFAEALDISLELGHDEGVVYGLDGLLGVAAARGQAESVGLLSGAVARLRRRTGLVNEAGFTPQSAAVEALRAAGGAAVIDEAAVRGEQMPLAKVLEHVRG